MVGPVRFGHGKARFMNLSRRGMAAHDKARLGGTRHGWVWLDEAGRGAARYVLAGHGKARLGQAGQGWTWRDLVGRVRSRSGKASLGMVWYGSAWHRKARQGKVP